MLRRHGLTSHVLIVSTLLFSRVHLLVDLVVLRDHLTCILRAALSLVLNVVHLHLASHLNSGYYRVDSSKLVGTVELACIAEVRVVRQALMEVSFVILVLTRMRHVVLEA